MWEGTDVGGAVVHQQRFLHEGAQQHLPVAEWSAGNVHREADRPALIAEPLELIREDLSTLYYKQNRKMYLKTKIDCRRGERALRSAAGLSEEGEEKRGSVLYSYDYIKSLFICFKAH